MKFAHPPVLGVVGRASGSRQSDSHRRQHIVDTDLMEEKASQEFITPRPTVSKRVLILRTWGVPKMALGVPKSKF